MIREMTLGQRKLAAAQRPATARFWKEVLLGASATTFLPDHPLASRSSSPTQVTALHVDDAVWRRLNAISKGQDAALQTLLTALAAVLLHEYSGTRDILIGQAPANVGPLLRVLPLRLRIEPGETLRSMLAQARDVTLAAMEHHDFPVDLAGADPAVLVTLTGPGQQVSDTAGLLAADVELHFRRDAAGLALDVRADATRYTAQTAERIGRHYLKLLTESLASPGAELRSLDLRSDDDHTLMRMFNDTNRPFPQDVTLPELFAKTVAASPHATAVITADATYDFTDLDQASTRIARLLSERRMGPETIVGVLAHRSFETLAGIIGVLKAGCAYLPLDPALPTARLAYMLEDSLAPLVLTQPDLAGRLPADTATLMLESVGETGTAAADLHPRSAEDAAYVIYTSGSTGTPKGVVVEHRSVVNRLHWMQREYPIGPGDVILHKTPISFDVSVWELFWWLIEGAAVCLLEPGGEREPAAILDAIEHHQVTTIHFVPTMLGAFLDYLAVTGDASQLPTLRQVFASGEELGVQHVRRFATMVGQGELINLYGPTEATVDVGHYRTDPARDVVPIGRPIDNTRLYVIGESGGQRPIGMPGELYIAGSSLARGYLHRVGLTEERFPANPFPGETRAYRTGDLARLMPDGCLEFLGRMDSQVKIRGYRVELGEIEHHLRSHSDISDAAAVVRTGADGQQHLYAYVVPTGQVPEEELRSDLATVLPEYMVPERVMNVSALPTSSNGKLDRDALPEPAMGRAGYTAPRNECERLLAEIWAEVLGLEHVGVDENFFTLGGNSIHSISVLAKLRGHGIALTFQELFQHPNVAELAEHTSQVRPETSVPAEFRPFSMLTSEDRTSLPAGIEDAYPMSMLQAGLIYQSEIMRGNVSYHDIISYLIQSSIDLDVFREAVGILVEQNPIFRTSYHLTGYSQYLQMVHEDVAELPLVVEDVRHIEDSAGQDAWYARWFEQEQNRPFDWGKPGLIRLHVHVIRDDLYRYSISQHNSALDGWSINRVHTSLFAIYYSLLADREYIGTPVPNHLRNFIGLEQYSIGSSEHRQFWQEALRDRPITEIPRLRPFDPKRELEVVFQDIELPGGLSDRLIELARTLGLPLKDLLLAAHLKVHTVLCGTSDVITGYEHSGRPELPDADLALGVFLNTVPLRVKVADGTWEQLIRSTYESEAALLPYRRYPMANVKKDFHTTEPLFETVFNFTHFYSLKKLRELPEFALLDVRAAAITEFPLRTEFSQHFYTDEVQLSLHYHTAAFDQERIRRIGGYLVRALQLMTDDPRASHNATALLDEHELAELAVFSAANPAGVRVLDSARNPAPIGSYGRVTASGSSSSSGSSEDRGRWLPDGTLQRASLPADAPTASLAPRPKEVSASANLAPRPIVDRIVTAWAQALDLPPAKIGPTDDFFELGGSSLAAMRVALSLEGLVTLRDVMRFSHLDELIDVAGRAGAAEPEGVLVPLSEAVAAPRATLVCIPYAGGNAIHFKPVADAMLRLAPDVAVLAAELPGHAPGPDDAPLTDFAETARLIASEIQRTVDSPVLLWGHCVGSALAIEVARWLHDEYGRRVEHLFLAAKLFESATVLRETVTNAQNLSFADIRDWLMAWTGQEDLHEMGDGFEDMLTRIFRHDSVTANQFLLDRREEGGWAPLPLTCTVVMSTDDMATQGYQDRYLDWGLLVSGPRLREIDGGHYFTRTRPAMVAGLVVEVLTPERLTQ